MPDKKLPWYSVVGAIVHKEALCELRSSYAFSALTMFALVTLASISMSLAGAAISSALAAALLWIILFFCAMAGLSRVFVQEQEAGTLLTLRLYANGQAVYFGKTLFNGLLLIAVTVLVIPLFVILLNVTIPLWLELGAVLMLGDVGIATIATLTALMVCQAGGKGALYTVVTFPLLLPQFLMVIAATACIFDGILPGVQDFVFMAGYDITAIIAASILFDYLWEN
ncbi:CcmB protein [Sporomusa ovata DSM 2662]|uniref:ABC transporter involved in cytochrome c biogenesis, CcmB subunit n=1 Tax=Sporomusa ovata TaxID=2378 RepID=A0A0U1KXX7_9FIRM|nr:heme exporter protein CcmB [Sporomusa ovata]EQB28241.1 cytochrome c-type biogenesis protein CcmB [Sporomusa ovata DSM 2662]CQR71783.1 ABC transporter involved in cytochrome c biogenesis, CcmB subunit [Sporomusa ovata]